MALYRSLIGERVEVFDHIGWWLFLKEHCNDNNLLETRGEMLPTDPRDSEPEEEEEELEVNTDLVKRFLNEEEIAELVKAYRHYGGLKRADEKAEARREAKAKAKKEEEAGAAEAQGDEKQ